MMSTFLLFLFSFQSRTIFPGLQAQLRASLLVMESAKSGRVYLSRASLENKVADLFPHGMFLIQSKKEHKIMIFHHASNVNIVAVFSSAEKAKALFCGGFAGWMRTHGPSFEPSLLHQKNPKDIAPTLQEWLQKKYVVWVNPLWDYVAKKALPQLVWSVAEKDEQKEADCMAE